MLFALIYFLIVFITFFFPFSFSFFLSRILRKKNVFWAGLQLFTATWNIVEFVLSSELSIFCLLSQLLHRFFPVKEGNKTDNNSNNDKKRCRARNNRSEKICFKNVRTRTRWETFSAFLKTYIRHDSCFIIYFFLLPPYRLHCLQYFSFLFISFLFFGHFIHMFCFPFSFLIFFVLASSSLSYPSSFS